ncbi:uncharacterized protein KZ484_023980 [Pholidichthys leucotaenia]
MSAAVDFHSHIASIMEVLANAAVAEICKVVDDGYAAIHLEMSRSQKENEVLRRKIVLLELQLARYRAEGSGSRLLHWQSKDPPAGSSLQGGTRFLNRGPGVQQAVQKIQPMDLDQDPDQEVVTTTKTEDQGCLRTMDSPQSHERNMNEVQGDAPGGHSPFQRQVEWQEDDGIRDTKQLSCSTSKAEDSSFSQTKPSGFLADSRMGQNNEKQGNSEFSDFTKMASLPLGKEDTCSGVQMSAGVEDGRANEGTTVSSVRSLLSTSDAAYGSHSSTFSCPSVATVHFQNQQTQSSWSEMLNVVNLPNQTTLYQASSSQKQHQLPYACTFCSRRYAHQCQLRIHERVHTGEKPYQCIQCGKRFGQFCSLKRHQMVHTGERPFPCPHCGKQFSTSTNLKVHQSVHTGEKRFHCSKCGKNFSFLSNLIRHQALHTTK